MPLLLTFALSLSDMSLRFIEYGEHRGYLYGTSIDAAKQVLDSGKICVVDIEPHVSVSRKFNILSCSAYSISLSVSVK